MGSVDINKELVLLNEEAYSSDEILGKMANHLYHLGYVKSTFNKAVKDREIAFATGLPTESFGIAIPHADIEHVNNACICVATLKKPVDFRMMSNHDQIIKTSIVVMLALKEGHQHMELLSKLIMFIQDPVVLEKIYQSKSAKEVSDYFKEAI